MFRLVTRGDDAGSSRSANLAIRDAFEHGILRNASILATGPEIEDAAEKLAGLPGLCCGLHATVTSEWDYPRWSPVLSRDQVPSLFDEEGMLHRQATPLHEKKAPAEEVIAEIAAQLARVKSLGFDLKYMDTHMGFTWLDSVDGKMKELARIEGLIYEPAFERLPRPRGEFAKHDHASRLLSSLKQAPDGTYLTVGHPTFDDDEMRACWGAGNAKGEVGLDRDGQRLMYMREDVLAFCEERGIVATRYDEL